MTGQYQRVAAARIKGQQEAAAAAGLAAPSGWSRPRALSSAGGPSRASRLQRTATASGASPQRQAAEDAAAAAIAALPGAPRQLRPFMSQGTAAARAAAAAGKHAHTSDSGSPGTGQRPDRGAMAMLKRFLTQGRASSREGAGAGPVGEAEEAEGRQQDPGGEPGLTTWLADQDEVDEGYGDATPGGGMEDALKAVFGRPVSGRRMQQLPEEAASATPEPFVAPEPEAPQPMMCVAMTTAEAGEAQASPTPVRPNSGSRDGRPPISAPRVENSSRSVRFRCSREQIAEEDFDSPPASLPRLSLNGSGHRSDAPRSSALLAVSPKTPDGQPLALEAYLDPEGEVDHEAGPPGYLAPEHNGSALLSQGSSSRDPDEGVSATSQAGRCIFCLFLLTSSCLLCRRLGTASTSSTAKGLVTQATSLLRLSSAAQSDPRG